MIYKYVQYSHNIILILFKYLVANSTLFGYLCISYIGTGTIWRLMRRRLIHTVQYFDWGLLVVLSGRCGLEVWMHWSWIDVIVLGLKSIEELYPSPPLGVDSADISQLPKEKNLHGQPLSLCTNRGGLILLVNTCDNQQSLFILVYIA
jgi:hypothetical protein